MRGKFALPLRVLVLAFYLFNCPFNSLPLYAAALNEYQIKAAFLYQFTKFVEWPSIGNTAAPFTVCVLGENSFEETLRQLEKGSIKQRPVEVQILHDIYQVQSCQILFISKSEKPRISKYLTQVKHDPVLTVGETPDFLERGGMINFIQEGNKIRFMINQKRALETGIKISSKLLSVASKVIT